MSPAILWLLALAGCGVVVARRRSLGIVLCGTQSLLLGIEALTASGGRSDEVVAGVLLLVKGLALPALLLFVVTRTREARALTSDRHALVRLGLTFAAALLTALLMPRFGLRSQALQDTAVGLVVTGMLVAILRAAAIFQVLGFLVAENGLYLAALGLHGGMPAVIELGLAFDLVVLVSVAGVLSARIHQALGTSDTSLLGGLRD